MKDNFPYEDIINLPHHQSETRPHMSLHDRAAQFSPFAALTGHDEAIAETARLTGEKVNLSDEQADRLNEQLRRAAEMLPERPKVQIVHFLPDQRKKGGSYVTTEGRIRHMDMARRVIVLIGGTEIQIDDISEITIED